MPAPPPYELIDDIPLEVEAPDGDAKQVGVVVEVVIVDGEGEKPIVVVLLVV